MRPKTTSEIALELKIAESTVRVLLSRAVRKIEAANEVHRFAGAVLLSREIANVRAKYN